MSGDNVKYQKYPCHDQHQLRPAPAGAHLQPPSHAHGPIAINEPHHARRGVLKQGPVLAPVCRVVVHVCAAGVQAAEAGIRLCKAVREGAVVGQ